MSYIKRDIEDQILASLDNTKALFVLGARQVGKTTLIRHLRQIVGFDRSLYYDIEIPEFLDLFSGSLENILARLRFDRPTSGERTYIFIDEVQYISDFSKVIKIFTDHYSQEFKFILTGSSSLLIRQQFNESLAGRKDILTLYPLSFTEFCLFKGEDRIATKIGENDLTSINPLWQMTDKLTALQNEYTLYGGYPGVVLLDSHAAKTALLNDLVSSFILKDIRHILRIEKINELNRLALSLAANIGKEVSISELSRNVGLHNETTQKYMMAMEESFIISILRPWFSKSDIEMRKMPKIYCVDTGIRNMLINYFSPMDTRPDKGELAENFFFLNLLYHKTITQKLNYWKTKQGAEIDFVVSDSGKVTAYEVKYGNDNSNSFRAFRSAYSDAECRIARYKYTWKEGEVPLWYKL